ncbi:NAD(P)-dependent oxidoreductase [Sulfobacillus harzensis]|uniref:NAD(P)-dependent oxidoreductase n=1 Tax=Sulfobacillus harzensis TaxID=2729629 RepID=A0A7Y0L4T9_9FIRM|nr:NAD(P)-dependent oxidoreductase [Sulfobacillus harzensis]NMP23339.1 NAD(P)-dependent oxidoreductase [Sulfobacillus harzensis]
MAERVAFIGLGIMGQAMALNLHKQYPLIVHNRSANRADPLLAEGAVWAGSPRLAAQEADYVFLMLKDDQAVRAMVEGPEGVFEGVRPGAIIVDHSTISPETTRNLAKTAKSRGVAWCDAPVTGGDIGAREATLTIMVGAGAPEFARIKPLLAVMGQRIVHVGAVGQGQSRKLVANMVSGLTLMAASEGVRMGLALGLPLETLDAVMTHGSAQSFELAKVLDRLRHANYAPGFSVDNRYKDLRLAVELAESVGFAANMAKFAEGLFGEHLKAGFADWDEASYIKRWGES